MRIPKGQLYGMHKAISTNISRAKSTFIIKFKMFKIIQFRKVKGIRK